VDNPEGGHYILDSYKPGEEIVSRKLTQLSEVTEETAKRYVRKAANEYPPDTIISDTPENLKKYPNLVGQKLTGQLYLEVPIQENAVPQKILDTAKKYNVKIRDVNGKVY
jgi:hypothetical protein